MLQMLREQKRAVLNETSHYSAVLVDARCVFRVTFRVAIPGSGSLASWRVGELASPGITRKCAQKLWACSPLSM